MKPDARRIAIPKPQFRTKLFGQFEDLAMLEQEITADKLQALTGFTADPVSANAAEIVALARKGKPFILTDREDRENEGDLIIPAEFATPEVIAFMARECRGLICLALQHSIAERLGLAPVNRTDNSDRATAFTPSIEAVEGITTGISAADRATTIAAAIHPEGRHRISSPGHMFPLVARPGGVLERDGHTEASVDIAAFAECTPAAVICEIMNDDGSMARRGDLEVFARRFGLKIGTIDDLKEYARAQASRALETNSVFALEES